MSYRAGALIWTGLMGTGFLDGAPVDFRREIAPILEQKCYRCHDGEKVKGDLRLDSPAGIVAGGKGGAVLVPGAPNESPVYVLTTYPKDDPDYMPQKGKGLTSGEQALLKAWIKEGAAFGDGFSPTPSATARSKYSSTDGGSERKYLIMGEAVEIVAGLRNSGLLVDTANHDASLFEVSYTYAEREPGGFDFSVLVPLKGALKKLTLARTEVSDEDLEALGDLKSIEFLDISRTSIGDEAMETISRLENLKILNLRDTNVSDTGLEKLVRLGRLERVYVWGTAVTERGAKEFERRLDGVSVIRGNPIVAPSRRGGA